MPNPAPGTLKYVILHKIPISIRQDEVKIIISDGDSARLNTQKAPTGANLSNVPHQILVQLWNTGQQVSMKHWRTATHRRDDSLMADTVDEILRVLASSATPSISTIFIAAQQVLVLTEKMDDWNKLNTLLQNMNEQQLRQFLSFIILVVLSKAAGE